MFKTMLSITLAILAIAGCANARATPTTAIAPAETDVARAVEATLTALAPTATSSPAPTSTPRPSATPSPAPTPIPVPEGWIEYEAITGEFTLAHPPSWAVSDETPAIAYFRAPNFALFSAGVSNPECVYGPDQEDTASLDCFVALVAGILGRDDSFRLVDKGTWDDGTYNGYIIEAVTYDSIYDQYSYHIKVFIPLQGKLLHASYFRAGAKSITGNEREAFTMALRSIRLSDEGHFATAAATATIYARDEQGELLPGGLVSVWDDYDARSKIVAKCEDGEPVTVIRRSGGGVLIETQAGQQGWVSEWFIKD